MKKLLLVPVMAALLFTSCKDDPKLEAPEINAINFSKDKAAVGQVITVSSSVTDGDTDAGALTYKWSGTDGFSSTDREAVWVPESVGEQVITLTVSDGTTTATQEARMQVVEPDFRLGLWGDDAASIIASEENADNELLDNVNGLLIYLSDEPNAADAYLLEADALTLAATIYVRDYSETELNRYIEDFNAKKASLTQAYGTSEDWTEWANSDAEAQYANNPSQWGKAIAEGVLVLSSAWEYSNTTGIALTLESDDDGGIFYALIYFPLNQGGRYAADAKTKAPSQKAFKQLQQLKRLNLSK